MATDPIAVYQEAINNLEKATRTAENFVEVITDAANKLRDWKHTIISNSGIGFPAELVMGQHPSINAQNWPTADRLAEALAGWHKVRHAASNAYSAIPDNRRGVVQPPPSFR
jgi:hypothetical protein